MVAAGQFEVRADQTRNLQIVLKQLESAARDHRARLIVFPETALSGYAPTQHGCDAARIDFPALARAEGAVRAAARRFKIAVIVGTTTRADKMYYNTALTIGPDGRVLQCYHKMHLTGWQDAPARRSLDSASYARGPKGQLKPLTVAGQRIGVQICLEVRFPEPWRLLAQAGARIFAHPTFAAAREGLWKRPAFEGNLSSRASENACWLIHANVSNPGQFCTSRIIDPDGLVVVAAQDECEQVISAGIDPAWLGRGNFIQALRKDAFTLKAR